jgi:arginine/lysine/ornithine decarboxylase
VPRHSGVPDADAQQHGVIGPIPMDEFPWENIEKKIRAHPFARNVKTKPRILTITQSTYDGVLSNVDTIKDLLSTKIDTLHFDEAYLYTSTSPQYAIIASCDVAAAARARYAVTVIVPPIVS